jgi:hypothetical protein
MHEMLMENDEKVDEMNDSEKGQLPKKKKNHK